jgi:thioredoxin reductase (NADPH)
VRLTLLSREWCHLCDEMQEALRPLVAGSGAQVTVIDVDDPAHAALETVWGDDVPVLFAGDPESRNELCRHRLDAGRVAAALANAE